MPTFQILDNPIRIKCLLCDRISYGWEAINRRYCGFCNTFHADEIQRQWYVEQIDYLADWLIEEDIDEFRELVKEMEQWREQKNGMIRWS